MKRNALVQRQYTVWVKKYPVFEISHTRSANTNILRIIMKRNALVQRQYTVWVKKYPVFEISHTRRLNYHAISSPSEPLAQVS